jgi:small subunit ribosomal protein S4
MAKYTGSKAKLSRRVGRNLFLKGSRSFSSKDDYTKKPYKPGMHGKNKKFVKASAFSIVNKEKQAIKYTYGLMEKQFANIFKKAFKAKGDTGKIALQMLERRLDNVVLEAGLANSRYQARQLVNHGHITVNDRKVNIPSFVVSQGDTVAVKENKLKKPFWQNFQLEIKKQPPSWIDASQKFKAKIITLPLEEDLPKQFNLNVVVEYYSRKVG